jgi:uncharacterized protein with beta-barrel porin domain
VGGALRAFYARETRSKSARAVAASLGAAYSFAPNASVILGYVDFHSRDLDDCVTTQVDLNF